MTEPAEDTTAEAKTEVEAEAKTEVEAEAKTEVEAEPEEEVKSVNDQMLDAMMEGKKEEVVRLITEEGADIMAKNHYGWTPLHDASGRGNADVVELLLSKGADVNDRSNSGWTTLHVACRQGREDVVKMLLAAGAEVEPRDNIKWTPLHHAADLGRTGTVKILIEAGADPDLVACNGNVALHYAIRLAQRDMEEGKRFEKTVRALLDAGASLDIKNKAGKTPMDTAKETKKLRRTMLFMLKDVYDERKAAAAAAEAAKKEEEEKGEVSPPVAPAIKATG